MISLSKGQKISLSKSNGTALTNARVNITWRDTGSDIDVSAVFLNQHGTFAYGTEYVETLDGWHMEHNGKTSKWAYKSAVYYQNPTGVGVDGIEHSGDVKSGGDHNGETISIQLNRIPNEINAIALVVTSHTETSTANMFGNANPTATVVDGDTGEELFRFELGYDASNFTSADLGELRRIGNGWEFVATGSGIGTSAQGLEDVFRKYI